MLYRIDCSACGAARMSNGVAGNVMPIDSECPGCGSTEYTVPAFVNDS